MEKFIGKTFQLSDGTLVTLEEIVQAKVVLLYFSGIWCPPCHGFEPVMKNFYKEVNKGCDPKHKNVEVVFVSCDNSVEEYEEHVAAMSYPSIPFDDPRIADLEEDLDVESIPIVPLLRKNGTIARDSVRQMIQTQGAKCFPDLLKLSEE